MKHEKAKVKYRAKLDNPKALKETKTVKVVIGISPPLDEVNREYKRLAVKFSTLC